MLSGLLLLALVATPKVGDVAPDFVVTDTEGQELKLSALVKEGPVVLAFFPKAFSAGCTAELKAWRDKYADVQQQKGVVIAVSTDDLATQKKFRSELHAPMHFVADSDSLLTRAYDLKTPLLGWAKRATFVIGPGRKVLELQEGMDAIAPEGAIMACSLRKDGGA